MPTIRPETLEDIDSIRNVNEQAFGGKEEAEIVEKLRNRAALTVSLVAVQNNEVAGHIAFSPGHRFYSPWRLYSSRSSF